MDSASSTVSGVRFASSAISNSSTWARVTVLHVEREGLAQAQTWMQASVSLCALQQVLGASTERAAGSGELAVLRGQA